MNMRYIKDVVTLRLEQERCGGCGRCVEVCPHGVFVINDGEAAIAVRDACMECGACARNCPSGAIFVKNGVGCAAGMVNASLGLNSGCCCDGQPSCCS